MLQKIINTDSVSRVREKAINKYVVLEKDKSVPVLENTLIKDSSSFVLATTINHIANYNYSKAYAAAQKFTEMDNPVILNAIGAVFKDTTADNLDFFKKAIWLNDPRSAYSNFKNFGDYLKNTNTIVLEKATVFLTDIYKHEESNYNKTGAKNLVKNLKIYFEEKAKKDQLADIKLQIIKKLAKDIL
jgi:hypothetical protein